MNQVQVNLETPKIQSKSKRLWLALILGTLSAFGPLSLDMYLPALPVLTEDLSTSASYAQLSLTACMVGLAIGQIFAGPISDVKGRRTPLLVGLFLYILSSLLCIVAPSIEIFVILRFIQGGAGAVGIVISRAIVRDLYSGTELTKFFALLMLVNGSAPILAPIAGGQFLEFTSWRGIFFVLSLIGMITLFFVFSSLGETLPKERRSEGGLKQTFQTFRQIISNRLFMGYALTQGFIGAGLFAYIAGSPFVLQNIYQLSPQMFSLCFAVNGVGIIIFTQLTGKLAGRFGETKLLMIGLGLSAVAGTSLLLMILLNIGLIAILIPLFILVSCVGVVNTSIFSLAMRDQANSAGSASALLGLMTFLFGGIVAPFVGIAGENTALPLGVIIATAEIGALVIYFVLVGRSKQNRARN
ncbi:multidrug effflux MFS transporter [Peribacillus huizhouensis]|uniref:Bcr/CflA family efflux transporter n=1 Tax=Peribacillus huizhouensis TaxID=1501239 RepID=A0ABR6CPZ6_9BACI|nr:multidrug effflux MFS transporter [Peribacillus huizhouensis]MBA9027035.1 DHA1 family bicyclomycin/chloramphenicol resistance-like MFS transporter [Peribacillus huizhouensis]